MAATPGSYQKPATSPSPDSRGGERLSIRCAIPAVKDKVSCLVVADYHAAGQGGAWRRSGADRWTRRCILPDHDDRTPSFVVYVESDSFWCFGCQRGGDAIDLEKLCGGHSETWTAVMELVRRYDVELPRRSDKWHRRQDAKVGAWDALRDVVAESYRRKLFRVVGPILEGIWDPTEREAEARRMWDALWPVARDMAERRLFERQSA